MCNVQVAVLVAAALPPVILGACSDEAFWEVTVSALIAYTDRCQVIFYNPYFFFY